MANKTKTFKNTSGTSLTPISPMKGIEQFNCTTKAGNTLSFFYNSDNDLVVVDLVNKDETGGNELFRLTLDEKMLLGAGE